MSTYARPKNPQTVPSTKLRVFDGIGGPQTQILKRFNFKQWDISETVANEVQDFHLGEKGSLLLRPGMRRLNSVDYTVAWIGQITIGGLLRYGFIYNNGLELVDIPARLGYELLEWPEPDAMPDAMPDDWPDDWPTPSDPVSPYIPEDPSEPTSEQICDVHWEWDDSPVGLAFSMPYAGDVTPSSDRWYWKGEGFRPEFITGVYSQDAAWYDSSLLDGGAFDQAPCHAVQWGGLSITPTGKDSAGDWLAPGVYNATKTLTMSDGTELDVAITLVVAPPAMTITPASGSKQIIEDTSSAQSYELEIENTGDAGSVLNWEVASISGDAAITALMSVSPSSGALEKDETETVTITISDPSSLDIGTYTATVTFRDENLTSITGTFDVSLQVIPLYKGEIHIHVLETADDPPGWHRENSGNVAPSIWPDPNFYPYWEWQYVIAEYICGGREIATGNWRFYWADAGGFADSSGTISTFNKTTGCPTGSWSGLGPPGVWNITRNITISPPT